MKNNLKKIIFIAGAVIILALLIIPKLGSSKASAGPGAGFNPNAAISVKGHILKGEELANNVLTSGTVLANEEVELKTEVSGKITNIYFKEGTSVRKGDILLKIDDSELQAQLNRAQYRLELVKDNEFRQHKLLEKEAISQEEYDQSLSELNVNKAEVQLIKAQIDKTEIKAPFSGVIGLKNVSEGSYVTPSVVIATLQSLNPIKVDFSVPEKYVGSVHRGDKVNFTIAGNDKVYTATVYAIEPKIDAVTRSLKIRSICPNPNGKIYPGAFADVKLVLHEIKDALMVPTEAIVPELKGQKVYLVKDGKVFPQSVDIGIRTDKRVQVTSGLKDQDTVIVSGILQVRPGMPVKISEFD